MKKILSIALIVALVATSAFAGTFSGSAEIKFVNDFDKETYGFSNCSGAKLKWGYSFDSGVGTKAGEGDLKAVIEGEFSVSIKEAEHEKAEGIGVEIDKLSITKADIIYKDLVTVGILGPGDSADFAKAFYAVEAANNDAKKDPKSFTPNIVIASSKHPAFIASYMEAQGVPAAELKAFKALYYKPAGFTVSAAGFNGGFGINGTTEGAMNVLAYGITPSFAFGENVTAQGALAIYSGKTKADETNITSFTANAKAGYNTELIGANVALDVDAYSLFGSDTKYTVEVAANAKYDFVNAYFYMFSVDKFETVNVDAKVAAEKTISGVKLTASVTGRDLADKKQVLYYGSTKDYSTPVLNEREITAALDAETTIDAFKVTAGAAYGIYGKTLAANAGVEYTAEMFVANAGIELAMGFDPEFKMTKIAPTASISSDKVIDGATVSLAWTDANLAEKNDKRIADGKITASAKIEF